MYKITGILAIAALFGFAKIEATSLALSSDPNFRVRDQYPYIKKFQITVGPRSERDGEEIVIPIDSLRATKVQLAVDIPLTCLQTIEGRLGPVRKFYIWQKVWYIVVNLILNTTYTTHEILHI
ncbi:MAG: hypothetical protein LBJ92_00630 [Holosporales bacterium]|jgi:hypothetical protein|nr:hypothetical protein [Holosporales bacterium]